MSIVFDDHALLGLLDRTLNGVPSHFVRTTREHLSPLVATGKAAWPVRTGESSAALRVEDSVRTDGISVKVLNDCPHAYKVKYSRLTKTDIAEEIERMVKPATTAAGQAKLRDYWTRYMKRRHGDGAPTEELASASIWQVHLRRPIKAAEKELIQKVQYDLRILAGAT